MMESDDESDFARPMIPPATSTPRVVHHNLHDNLPDQPDVSPVPGDGEGVQVLPDALQDLQLPGNLEDKCLLCAEQLQDRKEINSTISKELQEDISMIYRLELYAFTWFKYPLTLS
jgi:hypothetical protein